MSQSTLMSKVRSWFGRRSGDAELPLMSDPDNRTTGNGAPASPATQVSIFRPWAKRDQAIENLQTGFTTLTDLMATIRDSLADQNHRQEELLRQLSHLPRVLETIPENSRLQSETLSAIHQQLEGQTAQQRQLIAILDRVSQTGGDQRKILESMRDRLDGLNEHDQMIADSLSSFAASLQSAGRNSETSTQVLQQLRDGINRRDEEITSLLKTQQSRHTVLLAVTAAMALAALVIASVGVYLLSTGGR